MAAPSVAPRLPVFPSYPYAGLPRAIYETPTAKASAPPPVDGADVAVPPSSSSSTSGLPPLDDITPSFRTPASTPAQTPASTPRVPRPSFLPSAVMLPPEAFRGEVPTTPVPSRFGTLGAPTAQASTPAVARPRSLQQLMRFAETQNLTTAQLIARLNQEKTEIAEELSDLTRRLNRLGETGADEGLVQSVVSAIQERVAQQRKLEEEIKLLLRVHSLWQIHELTTRDELDEAVHQANNLPRRKNKRNNKGGRRKHYSKSKLLGRRQSNKLRKRDLQS